MTVFKRLRLLVFSVLFFPVLGMLASCGDDGEKKPKEQSVPAEAQVTRGDLRVVVETTGRIEPNQSVEIKCKASGEVIALPFDVSDIVKKGDVVVRLDPEDEERSVKRAEVALAVSKAREKQARLDLEVAEKNLVSEKLRANAGLISARATEKEAKAKLERTQTLLKKGVVSRETLDQATSAHATALAELENAKARVEDVKTETSVIEKLKQAVEIAKAEVETDRLTLTDARKRLSETTVTAPMDAVVATRDVQVGQIIASGINNVGGGTTVMTLADLSKVFVLADVDESDIGRIHEGQEAKVTVDAFPGTVFPGKVSRIATQGLNTSDVVTFEVQIEIGGPDHTLLKPAMTADVEILIADEKKRSFGSCRSDCP